MIHKKYVRIGHGDYDWSKGKYTKEGVVVVYSYKEQRNECVALAALESMYTFFGSAVCRLRSFSKSLDHLEDLKPQWAVEGVYDEYPETDSRVICVIVDSEDSGMRSKFFSRSSTTVEILEDRIRSYEDCTDVWKSIITL